MRIPHLLALVSMVLAGCTPPVPPPAGDYHLAAQAPALVLTFAPGSDEPGRVDAERLRYLGATLPAWTVPELHATGPRALSRARSARRLLGRPLVLFADVPGEAGPDVAVLVVQPATGILADNCLGPGQPVIGDVWPGDDTRRATLLPAGCAVATALQAQVAAAAAGQDLLRGRPLPAGAATPFADAIERYYRRNDPGQHNGAAAVSGTGRGGETTPLQDGAGQTAPGTNPANPLLGPLPDGAAAPR